MPGTALRVDSLQAALEIDKLLDEHQGEIDSVHIDHDGFLYDLIRSHHEHPEYILPDREEMTAKTHCLRSFSQLIESACESRGIQVTGDVSPPNLARPGKIVAADLLLVPHGRITEEGIRENIRTYLGKDPSSARLACAQLWQWVHHETGVLDEGRIVTPELFEELLDDEVAATGEESARREELAGIVLDESFTMPAL